MGQMVTVVRKPSSNPEVVRYEINRSLTGMGHERYSSIDDIVDTRAVDDIARRLFEAGGVETVHINSSVITVHLAGGSLGEHLDDTIATMFRFYRDDDLTPAGIPAVENAAAPEAAEA